MLNEADTRAKLIDPKLHDAGWKEELIRREAITLGIIEDEDGTRGKKLIPDYVLYYNESLPIAVVEAKDEAKSHNAGMQQAKNYAKKLGVYFAYSTNGHKIEEFDFITNKQRTLDKFPSPEELWQRYSEKRIIEQKKIVDISPLVYPLYTREKKPRYYQLIAIRRVIEAILGGRKRILLTMATGTGKTYTAFQIVWKLIKSGYIRRVLFIADRVFLRDQAYNAFGPFEDARDVIEEGKARKTRDVYFSIYQSLYTERNGKRLYKEYPPNFFDLIIIDECHRSGYGTWKEILDHFGSAIQLGLTATPKVADNIDTYAYFGDPVYCYSMAQGIEDGFLAPYQIYRCFTNIDKNGLYISDAIKQGAQIRFENEEVEIRDLYTLENFEREIILPDRTKIICDHLAKQLEILGSMDKTIVFCVNMQHASEVAKELQNHFSYLGYSDYALRIVSEEPGVKDLFERFQDSEKKTPVVVTTVDLLTTGVDVPSIKNIVFLKSISSKVYFKQHLGRGCRIDDLSHKYIFRVIDYVNATRLLDAWDKPESIPIPPPKGPFDITINGVVVNDETGDGIEKARIIAQIAPNEQRITRSERGGRFKLKQLPHSPITLQIKKSKFRSKGLTINPEKVGELVIRLKPIKKEKRKIVIEGIEVHIAEETTIKLDDGTVLTEAKYIEYSKRGVVKRAATLNDLFNIWIDDKKRDKFLEELKQESIQAELISKILKMPDADDFDALAHITFNAPILTKSERVRGFINRKASLLDAIGTQARDIILTLLDKYRVGGIEEFKAKTFRVPPFDKMGYLRGIIQLFGGIENLKQTLETVKRELYEYR